MAIEITVSDRVRVKLSDLSPETTAALQKEFTHLNPARKKIDASIASLSRSSRSQQTQRVLRVLRAQQATEPLVQATWRTEQGILSLPRGGAARALSVLHDCGVTYEVFDERTEGTGPRAEYKHRVELRSYQWESVEPLFEQEQGLVRAPTGSGKTEILIRLIVMARLPALVIVWTKSLLEQWLRRLRVGLQIPESEIGIIQGSTRRIRPITIGMQQTLWKVAQEYRNVFGLVGADEVHRFASKTFMDVVDTFPARFRFGVSADERRRDRKEFLLYDTFGAVIGEAKKQQLVDSGAILDVEVVLVPTEFDRDWYQALDDAAKGQAFGRLIEEMGSDAKRNRIAVELASREVQQGEQVLLFAHRREHCRVLFADMAAREPRAGIFLGGQGDEAEFQRTLLGILDGSVRVAAGTYQAVGTGLDLPRLGRGVATTPVHNNRPFLDQVIGRLCRTSEGTGKKDARIYYLWDREVFGLAPLRNLVRWCSRVKVQVGGQLFDGRTYLKGQQDKSRETGE
jgi:superfamily II DNA or RNA helicase